MPTDKRFKPIKVTNGFAVVKIRLTERAAETVEKAAGDEPVATWCHRAVIREANRIADEERNK